MCDATFIIFIIFVVIVNVIIIDATWPRAWGTADTGMREKVPEVECRSLLRPLQVPGLR